MKAGHVGVLHVARTQIFYTYRSLVQKIAEPDLDNLLYFVVGTEIGQLVADSEPGDCCFCHYSGHGGKLRDDDGTWHFSSHKVWHGGDRKVVVDGSSVHYSHPLSLVFFVTSVVTP